MTQQTVTLQLPESVLRRARQAADALRHPLETVLAEMLDAVLPDVEDVPAEVRLELMQMTWLSDQELWAIAHSRMSDEQQAQMQELSELQTQRVLNVGEQTTLESLRQEYGRITLRKARAFALLSLRGGQPLLADN